MAGVLCVWDPWAKPWSGRSRVRLLAGARKFCVSWALNVHSASLITGRRFKRGVKGPVVKMIIRVLLVPKYWNS